MVFDLNLTFPQAGGGSVIAIHISNMSSLIIVMGSEEANTRCLI